MSDPLLLVADVGGTNTRVGLARGTMVDASSVRRFRNAEASGLEEVLSRYISDTGAAPDAAAACGAGPMRGDAVRLTNLDWWVSPSGIAEATGCATVSVLNDLQAQGFALPHIAPENLTPVLTGTGSPGPDATRLVVNVGTGLNAALVLRAGGHTIVPPSESGHVDLPVPTNDLRALDDWLSDRHDGFASAEEALSGRGVGHLYAWVCARHGAPVDPIPPSQDVMSLLNAGDPKAVEAARVFTELLGSYAASLALIQLPFGGLYLVGGMARAMTPHLTQFGFAEAFRNKGRFSESMDQFSVSAVEDDNAALTGCAASLVDQL